MIRTIVPIGALFFFVLSAGAKAADDPNCLVTLFKTAINDNINKENYVFMLDQVDEQHYDSVKNDLKIIFPEYFDGTWTEFKVKRDALRKKLQLTTDEKYSRQYTISALTPEGVTAYTNCLRALRDQTQLSLYPAKTQFNDQAVTFVVDLKSPAQLAGPARIEVLGATRLLSAPDPNDRVTTSRGVIHVEIRNLRDSRTISVERLSPRTPVRITAEESGLTADPPIEFGPVVKAVAKFVDVPIAPVEDTIHYIARRLQPGTNNMDWRWSYERLGSGGDVSRLTFVGNMCICASGQRQTSGDFHNAGRCISRVNTDDQLLPGTVRLNTQPDVSRPYSCGTPEQPQEAATVVEHGEDGDRYCFELRQSLNVPPSDSSACQIHFRMTGMIRKKQVVFETP
jgi:hypothetical protein